MPGHGLPRGAGLEDLYYVSERHRRADKACIGNGSDPETIEYLDFAHVLTETVLYRGHPLNRSWTRNCSD